MRRRDVLKLGAVAGATFALGGLPRLGRALAQTSIPRVDRLVMTNVVDNVYDIFARGGNIGDLNVQRTPLRPARRRCSPSTASPTTWSPCAEASGARSSSTSR